MDKTQLFNQVANMLNKTPGNTGKGASAKAGSEPTPGTKANSKAGMSNHNVTTKNKQNPNRTYPFNIVAKATERIGGR